MTESSDMARTRPIGRRALALASVVLLAAACGDSGPAADALPLGQEAVVQHAPPGSTGPATTIGVTALAVRTGTIAELEAGGFEVEEDQRDLTPVYVDARYANKGTEPIDRELGVSLEDQDGNLISAVTIFNFGGITYEPCADTTEGELAPGESFESCTLFLVESGRTPSVVSFLPYQPGTETDWVYWRTK